VRLVVLFADGSLTVMVVEQASLGVCAVWGFTREDQSDRRDRWSWPALAHRCLQTRRGSPWVVGLVLQLRQRWGTSVHGIQVAGGKR
jgi:hypothetical protein